MERKIASKFNIQEVYRTMNILNPYRFGSAPQTGGGYLLDTFPSAGFGTSFRRLREAYTGNVVKVRRSSDNLEVDIPFNGDYIDEAALLSHVGAGDGFISVFYDQSINGFDFSQTVTTYQPQIAASGVIYKINGFVTYINQSGNTFLKANPGVGFWNGIATDFRVIFHTGVNAIPSGNFISGSSAAYYAYTKSSIGDPSLRVGSPLYYVNNVQCVTGTDLHNATLNTMAVLSVTNLDFLEQSWSSVVTKYDKATSVRGYSNQPEWIVFNGDKAADRAAIESNINTYYGI